MRLDRNASTTNPPMDRTMPDPRPQWAKTSAKMREIQLHSLIESISPDAVALDVMGSEHTLPSGGLPEFHDSNCVKEVEVTTFTIRNLVLESQAEDSIHA